MSSNVNLLSVGAGSTAKVSVKASVKTASSQGSDFSKTLDQAQQARSKDTAKPENDYKSAAKDESTKDVQPEKPEVADGKEKADAADADTQPENAGGASDVQEKGEADGQPPAEGNDSTATDANPAAAMAASMAEGVIATQGQQPLAELNTYFKSTNYAQDVTNKELAEQQIGAKMGYIQQPNGEQQKQPLDSLQAASAMEEMAPVDAGTPSASQSNQVAQQSGEQKQPVSNVPNSIEALLGSKQQSQQTANANAAQGRNDNGRQLLNMLPGQRTFTTVQENSAAPQQENTVGINQLNDLIGQVEIVQGEGNSRGFAQQQNQNQQGGMTNSHGQQQGMQMPGEAAFDVVVPGEEITQENSLGKSQQDNVASFQQILGNAQNTDNAGAINEPQQAQQTNRTYNVPQQIVEQAKLLQNGQNSEMIIKLNPEHLGELSLKVSVNGNGGVTATFHTDNAQVRAILETSMIQLKQQLNEQGIKVDSVEVQTSLPDGQLPDGQAQQGFNQQSQGQHVRSQQIDLKDFEDTSEALAAGPVNNATTDIHDSEGNVISSGVDYSV
ncbi:flagellar hook-length control protein FliK [Anaerovibrio slackiae]|uniref:flagellar hook-length control protein FliK n=1 Tax=Anaerovibrio slackiae TaxID=2652309 RepID=UPI003863B6F8